MLGNPADTLESGAVAGIAQLVASSVKGLKNDNVTITDGTGQLLWPQGDAAGGGGGAGSSKQAAEARFDRALEANLNSMLTSTLGAGKARVQVNADLNVDQTKRNELKYAKKGVPQTVKTETEKLKGGGGQGRRHRGHRRQHPDLLRGRAPAAARQLQLPAQDQGAVGRLDKTVSETIVAPGAVNKLNVALLVDKSVPAATVKSLQQTIGTAAGVDAQRGDAITVTQMAFAKPEAPKAGPVPTDACSARSSGPASGLAALLFLFFTRRALKKREGEALAAPSLADRDRGARRALGSSSSRRASSAARRRGDDPRSRRGCRTPALRQLDQLMEREPERVAAQVKQWMADE